jgi:hypothetical protein
VERSPKLDPKSKPPSNTLQISGSKTIVNEQHGKNPSPKTNVPMFGQPLEEVVKRDGSVSGVPVIIEKGADCIEQNGTKSSVPSVVFRKSIYDRMTCCIQKGLNEEGIFRISPNLYALNDAKNQINSTGNSRKDLIPKKLLHLLIIIFSSFYSMQGLLILLEWIVH